jgi:sec-independent protein translocase protein TatC
MTNATQNQPDETLDGHELRMGLFEHLKELRDRAIRAFLSLVVGTAIGFFFAGQGLELLRQPYCTIVETAEECVFQILDPTGGVIVYFRIALTIGGIIAIPYITYQFMMFIVPGLTKRERGVILRSIPAVTLLFVLGVVFTWVLLLPPALGFLDDFLPNLFRTEWTADGYLSFVTALIFWMGVAFESPLVFFVLSVLGIVTPGGLAKNWRIAVVGAAVAAALITPTIDPVNMALVMGPLLVLYVLSILLTSIGARINRGGAPANS